MSRTIHLVSQNVQGYGLTDGRFLPCSGVSGTAGRFSPCSSSGPYKIHSHFKTTDIKWTSRVMVLVCNYRKNPGFSRKNNDRFSGNKNSRQSDGFQSLEGSYDMSSSKNGSLPSISNPQATSISGSREKEIVKMFKQIQTKLRKKTPIQREGKKKTQSRGEEDEHVVSLLEVLRENTTQRKTSCSRDFIVDDPKSDSPLDNELSDSVTDMSINGKNERIHPDTEIDDPSIDVILEKKCSDIVNGEALGYVSESPTRSPVPQVKCQPHSSDSVTATWINGKSKRILPDTEIDDPKIYGMLEEEHSDIDEGGYSGDEVEAEKAITDEGLRAMKLLELRALAKSRGLRGFSKLKKIDLLELLGGGST